MMPSCARLLSRVARGPGECLLHDLASHSSAYSEAAQDAGPSSVSSTSRARAVESGAAPTFSARPAMRPPSDDAAVRRAPSTPSTVCWSSAVLLVLSWGAGLLATLGRGQVSSDGPAHSLGHMLARLAAGLAMSAIAIVLLSIGYWASSLVRPAGYSLDDGRRGSA